MMHATFNANNEGVENRFAAACAGAGVVVVVVEDVDIDMRI